MASSGEVEGGAELTLHSVAVLACMAELLELMPAIKDRYSPETIMLAMLTCSGQLAAELVARGERTSDYVTRRGLEFLDLALAHSDVSAVITRTE